MEYKNNLANQRDTCKVLLFELLEHLAALEPERCCDALDPDGGYDLVSVPGWVWWIGHEEAPLPEQLAKLQASMQNAIADHGWDMVLQSALSLQGQVVYFAIVRHADHTEFVVEGSDPSTALASAYVQALEASQKIGDRNLEIEK